MGGGVMSKRSLVGRSVTVASSAKLSCPGDVLYEMYEQGLVVPIDFVKYCTLVVFIVFSCECYRRRPIGRQGCKDSICPIASTKTDEQSVRNDCKYHHECI